MKSQLQLNEIEKSHFKAIAINNSEILVIPSSSSAPIDNSQNRINARLVIYREALEECLKAIIKNIKNLPAGPCFSRPEFFRSQCRDVELTSRNVF